MKYENKDLCSKCGGICCKKSGCDYFPSDFDKLDIESLISKLQEGRISIVSAIIFEKLPNKKIIAQPFLYLRARNNNREIIDLVSLKTSCSQLGNSGCFYNINDRPSGGINLIPKENMKCYPSKNSINEIKKWGDHQKVLGRIVKKMTEMSVDAKFSLDIQNLFYDILVGNIDDVSEMELIDVKSMIPRLIEACPGEYYAAYNKYKTRNKINVLKK